MRNLLLRFQWAKEHRQEVGRIGNILSEKIISRRDKLYNEYLSLQKRKNETHDHEVRLEELDWIIGGCK